MRILNLMLCIIYLVWPVISAVVVPLKTPVFSDEKMPNYIQGMIDAVFAYPLHPPNHVPQSLSTELEITIRNDFLKNYCQSSMMMDTAGERLPMQILEMLNELVYFSDNDNQHTRILKDYFPIILNTVKEAVQGWSGQSKSELYFLLESVFNKATEGIQLNQRIGSHHLFGVHIVNIRSEIEQVKTEWTETKSLREIFNTNLLLGNSELYTDIRNTKPLKEAMDDQQLEK